MPNHEIRLTQLRRMLAEPFADLGEASAAIARDPSRLAQALVAEAAASDDVSSVESARAYIEARLVGPGRHGPGGGRGGGAGGGGDGAGGVGLTRLYPSHREKPCLTLQ